MGFKRLALLPAVSTSTSRKHLAASPPPGRPKTPADAAERELIKAEAAAAAAAAAAVDVSCRDGGRSTANSLPPSPFMFIYVHHNVLVPFSTNNSSRAVGRKVISAIRTSFPKSKCGFLIENYGRSMKNSGCSRFPKCFFLKSGKLSEHPPKLCAGILYSTTT